MRAARKRPRHKPVIGLLRGLRWVTFGCVLFQPTVKSKILVVDDEPEAVELAEFNLKQIARWGEVSDPRRGDFRLSSHWASFPLT